MWDNRFLGCKTGKDIVTKLSYLRFSMQKDITDEAERYNYYWIFKIMEKYKMPYRWAAKEFYSYGTSRLII